MSDAIVARRYAQALYQEAEAASKAETVDEDMQSLHETLDASRDLNQFFRSPIVSREKKEAVTGSLFDGKLDALIVRLMRMLIQKGREDILPGVVRQYAALRDERLGLVEATVRTAMPMEFDETESLRKALEARTGQKVRLKIEIEPDLIGGVIVRIGDRVYDGSVRHQLSTLRDQFEERAYLSN
ncbi:MAG: F0F1 ATP synthase subunit delta [Bacteroidota bacterium]